MKPWYDNPVCPPCPGVMDYGFHRGYHSSILRADGIGDGHGQCLGGFSDGGGNFAEYGGEDPELDNVGDGDGSYGVLHHSYGDGGSCNPPEYEDYERCPSGI